jgi:hypothetical protein
MWVVGIPFSKLRKKIFGGARVHRGGERWFRTEWLAQSLSEGLGSQARIEGGRFLIR